MLAVFLSQLTHSLPTENQELLM